MRIVYILTALAGCLLLSITLNAVSEDPLMAGRPDFYCEDFVHGATVVGTVGSWKGEHYVINMQIKTLQLDLKLVLHENKGFTQDDVYSTLQDEQNPDYQTCLNPETVPPPNRYNNQTCEPIPLSYTARTWNTLRRNTVAITAWTWNEFKRASKTTFDFMVTMVCKFCDRVKFTAEWTFDKVPCMAEWQRVMWTARWTRDKAAVLVEWTWYRLTRLTNGTWDIVSSIGNFCITVFGAFTDAVSKLYTVYLKSHVTYIKPVFSGITTQEIIRTLIFSFGLISTLLSLYTMIRYVIRRRRQARLDKEAAERLASAPEEPIWRPKPKKKKRNDKKGW